jgi:C-terminal peptidase prc
VILLHTQNRLLLGILILALLAVLPISVAEGAKSDPPPRGNEDRSSVAVDFAETVLQATRMLARAHVKKVHEADLIRWAIRGLYRRLGEKIPAQIGRRLTRIKGMARTDRLALLMDVRVQLGPCQALEKCRDIDLALEGIFRQLEPDAKQIPQLEARDRLTCICVVEHYTGVGLRLEKDAGTRLLRVVTPIKDGPAYKAGLRAGDLITRISRLKGGDETPRADGSFTELPRREVYSTRGLSATDGHRLILGRPESTVTLTVRRAGVGKPKDVDIVRQKVAEETVFGVRRRADDSWNFLIDRNNKIGYVRLSCLRRHTDRDMARALATLTRQGVKGLILDLRSNPGGLIDCAVRVAGRFVGHRLIVYFRTRHGRQVRYTGKRAGCFLKVPMVCLVNGGTSSMSEVIAACLQDHKRAVIIGERSYGDTGLRNVFRLKNGGLIMFSTALGCRPSGKNLTRWMTAGRESDTWGVIPNNGFAVKLSPAEQKALARHQQDQEIITRRGEGATGRKPTFTDRQLELALAYLRHDQAARLSVRKGNHG